ncbi:hypothetical protein [Cyprinid herpesvirus 2]|nr:hypothetical protein [Cyprinid herpesvirus 2]
MGLAQSAGEFLDVFSNYFVDSVFSGAHLDWVRAMDDYVARNIATKRLDDIQTEVKSRKDWEQTQTELADLDREAKELAVQIDRLQIELKSMTAHSMNENIRKLQTIKLNNLQAQFNNVYEMIATKTVSNTQYITAKQQAEILEHLAKQPRVSVDPTKALATQRDTRRVFERNKQSMTVINRLNQKTTGMDFGTINDVTEQHAMSPPSSSSSSSYYYNNTNKELIPDV